MISVRLTKSDVLPVSMAWLKPLRSSAARSRSALRGERIRHFNGHGSHLQVTMRTGALYRNEYEASMRWRRGVYFTLGAKNYNGWKTGADKAGACERHVLSVGVKNPL
jgi:hypothetical protein